MKVEDTCGYMECGVKEIRGSDADERDERVKFNEVKFAAVLTPTLRWPGKLKDLERLGRLSKLLVEQGHKYLPVPFVKT